MIEIYREAMSLLASQPGALFLGQSVLYSGTAMYETLSHIPAEQRIEFPVAENLQLGTATGLALQGFLPITVFPRIDFLLLALDQLVNHLDKLEHMSRGQFAPKVIIRTRVGTRKPLDPGPQHRQNHAEALKAMLDHVAVEEIEYAGDIMPAYTAALAYNGSTLVIEALR